MKKFVVSVLCVAVFFLGLGSLAENVGAKFKSDARALELIAKARQAIGGDEAIRAVRSLAIKGNSTLNFEINGETQNKQGEVEIALQLPNQMLKTIKIGKGEANATTQMIESTVFTAKTSDGKQMVFVGDANAPQKKIDVKVDTTNGQNGGKVVVKKSDGTVEEINLEQGQQQEIITKDGNKVIVRKVDGGNATFTANDGNTINLEDGKVIVKDVKIEKAGGNHNEMARLMLGLLLSSPEGVDVSYIYAGEENVNGNVCNAINAEFAGETFKLFLDKSSNLPVAMNYKGTKLPKLIKMDKTIKADGKPIEIKMPAPETADFQVKFSDFRGVNGVQFPHRWETSVNGKTDEVFEISNLEVNPANIADKFKAQPRMMKMVKAQ